MRKKHLVQQLLDVHYLFTLYNSFGAISVVKDEIKNKGFDIFNFDNCELSIESDNIHLYYVNCSGRYDVTVIKGDDGTTAFESDNIISLIEDVLNFTVEPLVGDIVYTSKNTYVFMASGLLDAKTLDVKNLDDVKKEGIKKIARGKTGPYKVIWKEGEVNV